MLYTDLISQQYNIIGEHSYYIPETWNLFRKQVWDSRCGTRFKLLEEIGREEGEKDVICRTSMQPRPILRQDRTSRIASPTRNSHALYWPKMFPIFRQERTLKSLGRDPIPVLPCPFQHYRQSGQANDTSFLSRPPTIPCFL